MKFRLLGYGLTVAGAIACGSVTFAQNVPAQFVVSGKAAEQIQDFTTINLATAERIAEECQRLAVEQKVAISIYVLDNDGNQLDWGRHDEFGWDGIAQIEADGKKYEKYQIGLTVAPADEPESPLYVSSHSGQLDPAMIEQITEFVEGLTPAQITRIRIALRTLGVGGGNVILIIVLFGLLIARGIAASIGTLMSDVYGVAQRAEGIATDPVLLTTAVVIGVATSMIAALLPARQASSVDPVHALQKGKYQVLSAGESRARAATAIVLLVVSAACLLASESRPIFYTGYVLAIAAALLLGRTRHVVGPAERHRTRKGDRRAVLALAG